MSATQRQKIMNTHEQYVDLQILEPGITQEEIAKRLGVLGSTVSIVMNSEMFIDYRRRRLAQHHKRVSQKTIEKVEAVTQLSLDVIHERIQKERSNIDLAAPFKVMDFGLAALGFGQAARGAAGVPTQVNITVNSDVLGRARARMKTIDVDLKENEGEKDALVPVPSTS